MDFDAESVGRELTCKKCGAVYEFRAYKSAAGGDGLMWDLKVPAQKTEGQEEPMKTNPKCKLCGKGSEVARIWGGYHKACRKISKQANDNGILRGKVKLSDTPPMQTGIVGMDGVVIPVRLEITVSLKVETK